MKHESPLNFGAKRLQSSQIYVLYNTRSVI